jgi:hypothetical protein
MNSNVVIGISIPLIVISASVSMLSGLASRKKGDIEKAQRTEVFNEFSVPDKVLLVQKKMAEVDCKAANGTTAPIFPAPTRPDDIQKALQTDGCKLAIP